MTYDFVVVGLGPAGITTALHLMNTGKSVLLLESKPSLGGCWSHSYTNQLYFSEHSPKVLFSHASHDFKALLNFLRIHPKFSPVYSKQTLVNLSVCYHIYRSFKLFDYIHTFIFIIRYILRVIFLKKNESRHTVYDWMLQNNISPEARNFIQMMCIVINGTNATNIQMDHFMKFILNPRHILGSIIQLSSPKEWLNTVYNQLSKDSNIDIRFNVRVELIQTRNGLVNTLVTHSGEQIEARQFILCVPIRNLFEISSRSEKLIQENWFNTLNDFRSFAKESSYSGIGIQFHFDEKIISRSLWCWSCVSEWVIIVVDKTNTLDVFSYDKSIKTVWSCVLCDTKTKNKIGKTPNDYQNENDLASEVLRQLSTQHGERLQPKHTTISNTVYRDQYGWESTASSFTNVFGSIPYTGNINNLHTVGPHNTEEIVVIDSSIKSARKFCKEVLKLNPLF
jgi:hypothetical protein